MDRLRCARLIENKAIVAVVRALGIDLAGNAIDPVETAEQHGCRIARVGEAVVRTRQLLLRHCTHYIGRDNHSELGGSIDVVAALKQSAEYWHLHGTRDEDRKSTRLNSSHLGISYAVFCLK